MRNCSGSQDITRRDSGLREYFAIDLRNISCGLKHLKIAREQLEDQSISRSMISSKIADYTDNPKISISEETANKSSLFDENFEILIDVPNGFVNQWVDVIAFRKNNKIIFYHKLNEKKLLASWEEDGFPHNWSKRISEVIHELINSFADRKEGSNPYPIFQLVKISKTSEKVIPALIQGLQNSDLLIRINSIHTLSEIGEKAKDALPYLEEIVKKDHNAVIGFAKQAIKKISGKT